MNRDDVGTVRERIHNRTADRITITPQPTQAPASDFEIAPTLKSPALPFYPSADGLALDTLALVMRAERPGSPVRLSIQSN